MNNVTYTSVKSAVSAYLKQADPDDEVDRTRLKSWANTAAAELSHANIKDISVIALPVSNYGAQLPDNFFEPIQILFRKNVEKFCKREEVVEWTQKCFGSDCQLRIIKECPKCHMHTPCECGIPPVIIQADHHWNNLHSGQHFVNNKTFKGEAIIGNRYDECKPKELEFNILHRTTNNFHSIKSDLNDDCKYPNYSCRDEYDIKEKRLVTSFKEGEVLVAYLSDKVDDDGYMMIVNDPIIMKAIVSSMMASEALRMYSRNRTQSDRIYWNDMTQLANYDMQKALLKISMPSFDKVKASIKNHWAKVIVNYNHAYNLGRYRPDEYNPESYINV